MIWRDIHRSAKHFLWQACHDIILPIRVNLFKKKVTDQICCPICTLKEETLTHALLECLSTVTNMWGEERSAPRKWVVSARNIKDLWDDIMDKVPTKMQ